MHYDECVSTVIAGVFSGFSYVTSGAMELRGVRPVDSIGHLFCLGRLCQWSFAIELFISCALAAIGERDYASRAVARRVVWHASLGG